MEKHKYELDTVATPKLSKLLIDHLKFDFQSISTISLVNGILHVETNGETETREIEQYIQKFKSEMSPLARFDKGKEVNLTIDNSDSLFANVESFLQQAFSETANRMKRNNNSERQVRTACIDSEWEVFRQELNRAITGIAESEFHASVVRTKDELTVTDAKRMGYFTEFHDRLLNITPSINESGSKEDHSDTKVESVLIPAVCLQLYPLLSDQRFEVPLTYDLDGMAFRNEGRARDDKERLEEFNVHELVCFATREEIEDYHARLMTMGYELLENLGLVSSLQTATDMFFGEHTKALTFSQLISDDKIEFMSNGGSSISLASLNKHHTKFSSLYQITNRENELLHSVCIGFGINRIIFALKSKYGTIDAYIKSRSLERNECLE